MSLFAPRTPSEEWALERDRIARRSPALALVPKSGDPRPDPDMFRWMTIEEAFTAAGRKQA